MKLFGKRFWASALSALMLLSAMPVQAFALDDATLVTSSMAVESVVSSENVSGVQPESVVAETNVVSSSVPTSSVEQTALAGIALDQTQVSVREGEHLQLTVAYTPTDVSVASAPIWSSSVPDVAFVDENGTVSALTQGSAIITVVVEDFSASCQVTVEPLPEFVTENGVLTAYNGLATEITVPNGVVEIADEVLKDNDTLEKLILPKGLVKIGAKAFSDCKNLKEIIFPDTLEEIGDEAFSGCEQLSAAELGEKVSRMGTNIFANCAEGFVLIAPENSVAAAYAQENGLAEQETGDQAPSSESEETVEVPQNSTMQPEVSQPVEQPQSNTALSGVPQDGWYTDAKGDTYYYIGGTAAKGVVTIGDKMYGFDETGVKVESGWLDWNGKSYWAKAEADGVLAKDEIAMTNNGKYAVFNASCEQVVDGFYTTASGKTYYQDASTGYRIATGKKTINGKIYLFNENGELQTSAGWVEASEGKYYLKADGSFAIGAEQIDGKWYGFDKNGLKVESGWLDWNGKSYWAKAEADGVLAKDEIAMTNNGKYAVFNASCEQVVDGFYTTASGKTYYQDASTGYRIATGKKTINGKIYLFNENGELQTSAGWVEASEGKYYLKADGSFATGAEQIDGKWYGFDENGVKVEGGWLGWNGKYYWAQESMDGELARDGICMTDNGKYAVFNASCEQVVSGFYTTGAGKIYYQDASIGYRIATGKKSIGGKIYLFSDKGELQTSEGWVNTPEGTYYLKSDGSFAMGTAQIGGKWYGFDETGVKVESGWLGWNGKYYWAQKDADGELARDGIFMTDNGKYAVFNASCEQVVDGFYKTTSGKTYYQDASTGYRIATGKKTINGKIYLFDDKGELQTSEGWVNAPEGTYYLKADGTLATGPMQISGKWYGFDKNGLKVESGWLDWNGKSYWAKAEADGVLAKDEIAMTNNGKYAVFNASCEQVVDGFYTTASGKTYYQDASTGYRIATGKKTIDGKIYLFNDKGELQTTQGWVTAPEGTYYLKADGSFVTGPAQIDGKWYAFDKDGLKVENGWLEWNGKYYWAKGEANGVLAQDELAMTDNGKYAVFNTSCEQVVNGFYTTKEGKTYYQALSTEYRIALGYHITGEGQMFYFDSKTGIFFEPSTMGWYTKDGKEYYYLAGGEIVRPPVIDSVTVTEVDSSTSKVTINASFPGSPCAGYSFDGGKTWQTSNSKTFTRGTVIAAGTLMVKDTTGGKGYIVSYDKQVDIPKVQLNGVYGIDVSKHQGEIDWNKVAASGVSFVIIRAVGCYENSRTSYIDPYFETNVRNAKAAGLNVGVYIYSLAKSTDEMISQVKFFLNSSEMQRLKADGIKFDYPVYIDYENSLVCQGTTYDERTNIVRTGMVVLDQNGYYPGFYTYHSFMSSFNVKSLVNEGYDFWYARYPMTPNPDVNPSTTYGLGFEVGMWQYCSDGNVNPDMNPYVDGVRTAVDLNRVYKDYPTLVHNKNGGSGTIPDPVDPVQTITVYDQNSKKNVTDSIDNLLPQIVQNEVGGFNSEEVWKAQAVAARSWLLYQMSISDNPPTVGLKTATQAVKNACAAVKDKVVTYNGTVANTLYGASNSTKTNSALNMWGTAVPYLIEEIDSPGDANATHSTASQGTVKSQGFTSTIGLAQMKANIEKMYPGSTANRTDYENWLTNPMRSSTGYVTSITVMGNKTSCGKFYDNCWGLFSPNFTMKYNGNGTWTFTTYGNGHCVGMSQWGAYGYAKEGRSWEWILNHYYPGTKVENY